MLTLPIICALACLAVIASIWVPEVVHWIRARRDVEPDPMQADQRDPWTDGLVQHGTDAQL